MINDICDINTDRLDPRKRLRPVASGAVSPAIAGIISALSAAAAFAVSYLTAGWAGLPLLSFYLAANIGYSLGLKHLPILDVAIVASGFVVRTLYGGAMANLPVSDWMLLTVMALSLYLSLGKRRGELGGSRRALAGYTKGFLDKNMYLCLGLTVVFYSLWSTDPNTPIARSGGSMVLTVPLVMCIVMRYSQRIESRDNANPVDVLLSDWVLLALLAAYVLIVLGIFYGGDIAAVLS